MWNPFDFTGKKIIIAGATSGMGKALAVKLSQQGAELSLIGRDLEKLKKIQSEIGACQSQVYVKDFSCPNGFQDTLDSIISDGKKIDGLVYCAGITKILPLSFLSKKNMDESMTVNLYSFAELIGQLSKKKYHNNASIVGISSIATLYPQKCQGVYVATKSAMNGMVTSMAMELAEKGMRINTVMPSSTRTKMYEDSLDGKNPEEIKSIEGKQVLGVADPNDIADIIMFLLSDASKMITGRAIYADAGCINFY
jgi:short-subunit dehydrogenase